MGKMVIFILVVFTLIMAGTVYAKEVKEIPFTLDDGDRLIRIETKVEEGLKSV